MNNKKEAIASFFITSTYIWAKDILLYKFEKGCRAFF
jgi:hypothetical protein